MGRNVENKASEYKLPQPLAHTMPYEQRIAGNLYHLKE